MYKTIFNALLLILFLGASSLEAQINLQLNSAVDREEMVYMQVNITFTSQESLQKLVSLGVEPLNIEKNIVSAIVSEREYASLNNYGFLTEVVIADMQQDFMKRNATNESRYGEKHNTDCDDASSTIEYSTPTNFELGSMAGFYTMEEVYAEFDQMHELYPDLITPLTPISNFETYEGRNLYLARVSDNASVDEDEAEMLYTAVHHAREPESISQLIFYVWYLLENYATDTEVQTILDNTELYILPLVNPDGYNYNATTFPDGGGLWRKNRRDHGDGTYGVDPNRNYGGPEWGTTGISFNTDSDVYCGEEPFSEPETQAVKWLCENRDFRMAFNNHTHGDLLLYPYGYALETYTDEDDYYVAVSAAMVSQNNYTDQVSSLLYAASGDSDDWMHDATPEKPTIYAFTPEIGYSFWPITADIIPIAKEMMYLNLTSSHLATDFATIQDQAPATINTLSPTASFTIQSLGLDLTNSFEVSLEAVSTNIASEGNPVTFTDMDNLQELLGSIGFTLNAGIEAGEVVEYYLVIDQGGFTTRELVSKVYGQSTPLFTDTADDLSNWNNDGWGLTTSSYYSAPSSITDSPNGDYQNSEASGIELAAAIDLTEAFSANLTFYAKWNIETDYDYVQVMVNDEPQCGLYTNAGTDNQDEDKPLYDGVQEDWVQEYIDLSEYLGQQIIVTFVLVSDNFVREDGFYFDDFQVNTTGEVSVRELDPNDINLLCSPNPAVDQVTFSIDPSKIYSQSELIITNELGQEILRDGFNASSLTLDISNLSAGIYYYSYQDANTRSSAKKMVVIK